MKFKRGTRLFGVHTDRVKMSVTEKLDDLEFGPDDQYYKFANKIKPQHYYGSSSSTPKRVLSKALKSVDNPNINYQPAVKKLKDQLNNYKWSQGDTRDKLINVTDDNLYNQVINNIPSDVKIKHVNSLVDSPASMSSDGTLKLNDSIPTKNPYILLHELAHHDQRVAPFYMQNNTPSDKYGNYRMKDNYKLALSDPDAVHDYINKRLSRENDANYRSVRQTYLMGGNNDQLKLSDDTAKHSNGMYNNEVAPGYVPLNLSYNMSPEAYERMMENKKQLGIK